VKIPEFHVIRYGPVGYKNPFALSDFTLFWGKNEQGKTLTIDALVKLLLGKEAKRFDKIERVEGPPSGHVVVSVGGRQVKLTAKETLTDVCELSEAECRNVFIVRASDLSIGLDQKEPEADFYAAVTDRLTGIETRRISRIVESIFSIARITPTGKFKDVKDEGLKLKLETALKMTGEINELQSDIQTEGVEALERQAIAEDETIGRLADELSALEDARKRKQYETGLAALQRLEEAIKQADELAQYLGDDERAWSDAERETERIAEDIARLRGQSEKKQAELENRTVELRAKERDFQIIKSRKQKIDEDVRPRFVSYEKRLGRNAENTQKKGLYTLLSALSAAVLCASLVGMIIRPQMLFTGLAAAAFLATTLCVAMLAWIVGGRARIERDFQEVRIDLARLELSGKTIQETLANLQKFNELYEKRLDEINGLRQDRTLLERQIGDIASEAIPRLEQKAATGRTTITDIQRRSGCRTVKELSDKIGARRRAESAISEGTAVLAGWFEQATGDAKKDIRLWRDRISELSSYRDTAPGIEFTEQIYRRKQDQKTAAEQRREELFAHLSAFRKRFEEVERQVNSVLATKDDYIYCDTSLDLASIAGKLSAFVSEHEEDRDAALAAVGIFEQIGQEEKGRISLLFDQDSGVSHYFSTITGGLYDAVLFDPADGLIRVRGRDGTELSADKLSSGAYDQLYLAIRLTLGRRIAPDGAGFFIMDDPFIRSDPDRLARQMAMLSDIARNGWQVLYFSSKGEVKDALAKEIKKGAVTLVEL
jgi:DNA repair protein SbcC/Rad50